MIKTSLQLLSPVFRLLLTLSVLTGLIYPLLMTGVAQMLFPFEANGSIIHVDGVAVGSKQVGQSFENPGFFWGRPSATSPQPYNAASSSGSNFGPTNPDFLKVVAERTAFMRQVHGQGPVPIDLVTASGSGLDPHISPAAALYQVSRIAKARGLTEADILKLVAQHTEGRQLGLLGEERVNVLALNVALRELHAKK